jgi:hypothetical protein
MNSLRLPNPKVTVSRIGLQISDNLSVEEWKELATSIGEAASSIAFIVGDWLVYGQSLFGTQGDPDRKVDHPSYQLALKATGLDLSTLQNYAYVSRNVPPFSTHRPFFAAPPTTLMGTPPTDGQAA